MQTDRHAELEERALALLSTRPQAGLVWQLLAVALRGQGKDALPALQTAARLRPEDAVAHFNLGNELARHGRLEHAAESYARAVSAQPRLAQARHHLGDMQLQLGRLAEAVASFQSALSIDADLPETHASLGRALMRLARPEDAIESFRRAVNISPEFTEAQANLGNALRSIGRLEEAAAAYRAALRSNPDFAPAYTELATALRLQRRSAEAEASCARALELAPHSGAALTVLAELRADSGCFAEAEDLFKRAAANDAESTEAWAGIARVRRMTRADAPWLAQAQRLVQRNLSPQRETPLRYAMGKYFDDIADCDAAFEQYQRANELARQCGPGHDRGRLTHTIDLIIRSHDRRWLDERAAGANSSLRPVFIVGMLRSGTSLAEQILASHPAVFGAGELTFWSAELAAELARIAAPEPPALQLGDARLQLGDTRLASLGNAYLELLHAQSPRAARVIDKLPTNFLTLGLIHAAFPLARIIHLQRNPIDTCLSIYFQHFEAANTYANDLEDLAHYYREYRRLMRHWRSVLPPGVLLEVPYESLVSDLERWTRSMLEFIAVPWDARCLDFHATSRQVVTASKWQVRQRIHTGSVERWRRYEKFAGPLRSLLESSSG